MRISFEELSVDKCLYEEHVHTIQKQLGDVKKFVQVRMCICTCVVHEAIIYDIHYTCTYCISDTQCTCMYLCNVSLQLLYVHKLVFILFHMFIK